MTDPEDKPMRIEVSRLIAAPAHEVFTVLQDPRGHVDIDASGMLMDATGEPVSAPGDRFTVHMDRRALGDLPWEDYDVEVVITVFEPDREIAWTIEGRLKPPLRHVYGYRLEPTGTGVLVTSYYDWSQLDPSWQSTSGSFPVVPESALKATLGILDRTVRRRAAQP
jgi:Polyketide cyclase / dehydrase and lipid transport